MYAITGATGHVGGAALRTLMERGERARALVRSENKGRSLGAHEVAVAAASDRAALAAAFRGVDAAFVMLPFGGVVEGIAASQRAMIDALAGAVADAAVPHVVMLSSVGAGREDSPRIIRWIGDLERALRGSGTTLTALRCTHFQERVAESVEAVRGGVYPVFADSADTPESLVATADIGTFVADALTRPSASHEVIDVRGPEYTERELAAALGAALGTSPTVLEVPREAWEQTMSEAGVPAPIAELLAEMYVAGAEGALLPTEERRLVGETRIEATIDAVLAAQPAT